MPRLPRVTPNTITEITRRDIFDRITMENVAWATLKFVGRKAFDVLGDQVVMA